VTGSERIVHHLVRLFVAADLGWWAAIAGLLSALTTILIRSLGSLSKWNSLFFFFEKGSRNATSGTVSFPFSRWQEFTALVGLDCKEKDPSLFAHHMACGHKPLICHPL